MNKTSKAFLCSSTTILAIRLPITTEVILDFQIASTKYFVFVCKIVNNN